MKPQTLQSMCPGVEALPDSLCFLVQSSHDPKIGYRVDKSAYWGSGSCSCDHFRFRHEPWLKAGKTPGPKYRCKHIEAVDRYQAIEVSQLILQHRQQEANANRAENGKRPLRYDPELPAY